MEDRIDNYEYGKDIVDVNDLYDKFTTNKFKLHRSGRVLILNTEKIIIINDLRKIIEKEEIREYK